MQNIYFIRLSTHFQSKHFFENLTAIFNFHFTSSQIQFYFHQALDSQLKLNYFFILKIVQSTEEIFYRTLSKIQLIFIYILRSV